MTPRNTSTGAVMEKMVLPALEMGGYTVRRGVNIGSRFGIGQHKIDVLAEDAKGRQHLISMKWQQVGGTAEQKIPFEVMCLVQALQDQRFHTAYLVLGGDGWKYKEFYLGGGLNERVVNADQVRIVSLERFVAVANQGALR